MEISGFNFLISDPPARLGPFCLLTITCKKEHNDKTFEIDIEALYKRLKTNRTACSPRKPVSALKGRVSRVYRINKNMV